MTIFTIRIHRFPEPQKTRNKTNIIINEACLIYIFMYIMRFLKDDDYVIEMYLNVL